MRITLELWMPDMEKDQERYTPGLIPIHGTPNQYSLSG